MNSTSGAIPGRWAVVRTDDHFLYVHPNVPHLEIGRAAHLAPEHQLRHAYASRVHLAIDLVSPNRLRISCKGKNPCFWGKACERLPAAIEFVVDSSVSSPTRGFNTTSAGAGGLVQVSVPPLDFTAVSALRRADRDESTIYFPDGLHLPDLHVAFESHAATPETQAAGRNAASATLSVAQMLAVPGLVNDEDEDEDAQVPRLLSSTDAASAPPRTLQTTPTHSAIATNVASAMSPPSPLPPQPPRGTATLSQSKNMTIIPAVASSGTLNPIPTAPAAAVNAKTNANKRERSLSDDIKDRTVSSSSMSSSMGVWMWKCHERGRDDDPRSWRQYPHAVQALLENAYVARKATVEVPDALMNSGGRSPHQNSNRDGSSTYGICFAEKSLKKKMIQYQLSDPSRYRAVRREGGPPVYRKGVRSVSVLPSSSDEDSVGSSSSEGDQSGDDDSSEEDSLSTVSSGSSSASSSSLVSDDDDSVPRRRAKKRPKR